MPPTIPPHRARYAFLDPHGTVAGEEAMAVEPDRDGLRVQSTIRFGGTAPIEARVDWHLFGDLSTRLLEILGHGPAGDEYTLELSISGNGLLAHRSGPDGPTQVELGWGPDAALDYISAAFPLVMVTKAGLRAGETRRIDTVHIDSEDLVPTTIERQLALVGAGAEGSTVESRVAATGHRAALTFDAAGLLEAYEGLTRREAVTLLPAPTK